MSLTSFSQLTQNILKSNRHELALPYRMTFILTSQCQLRCRICNIWTKSPAQELTLEEISRFFTHASHLSWINLSGGEIFLRRDIDQIFEVILRKCRNLHILNFPTNGFQTDTIVRSAKNLIAISKGTPKIFVTISLDGPPEVHRRIRGNEHTWDHAINTFQQLRQLRSRQFHVYLGMTLQPQNIDLIAETIRSVNNVASHISIDDFHFNVAQHSEHYYANTDIPLAPTQITWERLSNIITERKHKFFDPISFIEKKYQLHAKTYLATGRSPIPCQALGASFFMDPSGLVFPCVIYNKIIGNVKNFDYDLKKLWATEQRRSTRADIIKRECPQCWTPCEAYQSILANIIPKKAKKQ